MWRFRDMSGVLIAIYFVFIFCFIVIAIIKSIKNQKKINAKKDELVMNNQFLQKNREKYERILDDSLENEELDSGVLFGVTVIGIIFIGGSIFLFHNVILTIALAVIIIIVYNIIVSPIYASNNAKYNEVVKTILKEYDSNLEYYPDEGYTLEEYSALNFVESCDSFSTSDMIIDKTKGFKYADILVETEYTDDEGDTHYRVSFDGTLVSLDIKNIGAEIMLGDYGRSLFDDKYEKINFEDDEFNKEFTCFTNDEIKAYKLLTPDIMQEFLNVKKDTLDDMCIRIINDKLYIRFSGTNGFDVNVLNRKNEKEDLFKSVAVLDEIIKTMDKVKAIIDSKEIN